MRPSSDPVIYQLKVVLAKISPMIWRRLLVQGDTTLADLHYILQIAFGWSDEHLHRFILYGKEYGIPRIGGYWFSDDARQIRLAALGLRQRERFLYEYDGFDQWQHQIRVEAICAPDARQSYPVCLNGKRLGPPEDCGGALAFQALRQEYSEGFVAHRFAELLVEDNLQEHKAELRELRYWLLFENFDRNAINRRLQQVPLSADPVILEDSIPISNHEHQSPSFD